jgi:hypothetical protein
MRTTVDIPEDLYRQAQSKAAQTGIPVGELVACVLRRALGETPPGKRQRMSFPLVHSARPGVLSVQQVPDAEEAAALQEDATRARAL